MRVKRTTPVLDSQIFGTDDIQFQDLATSRNYRILLQLTTSHHRLITLITP